MTTNQQQQQHKCGEQKMSDADLRRAFQAKWHEHIAQTTGSNYYINDSPRYATFTHPGLTMDEIDRYGNPTVIKLLHLCMDTFSFVNNHPYEREGCPQLFLDWIGLKHDRLIFTAATVMHCSRAIYDKSLAKWPIDVKVSFGGIGSTSLHGFTEFFIQGIDEPVMTRYYKYVSIDKNTRKPTPFPDWFKNGCQGRGDLSVSDFRVERFQRPANTFVHRLMIVHSETDNNNHTHFSSYIKFGLDTLHLALRQKSESQMQIQNDSERPPSQNNPSAIKWLTEDIVKSGVKRLEIVFLKESFEGDQIDVHVWQEEDAEFVVKCSVEAMDKSVLNQFVVEYFTP